MRNILLTTLAVFGLMQTAQASTLSEPVPGTAGDSYICWNRPDQFEKDGYFHYVFTSAIKEGKTIQVVDYAANYKEISAKVVMATNEGFILASEDESFVLGVNTTEKSGTLEHRGVKDYELQCMLSGPMILE